MWNFSVKVVGSTFAVNLLVMAIETDKLSSLANATGEARLIDAAAVSSHEDVLERALRHMSMRTCRISRAAAATARTRTT